MGHFYNPPPPFTGGAQPLAPHSLNPSAEAVPVNEPAYSHTARGATSSAIARAWDAPLPDAYVQGSQPVSRRAWVTASGAPPTADDPPRLIRQPHILFAWDGVRRAPAVSGAPLTDPPPFAGAGKMLAFQLVTARQWEPAAPSPFLGGRQPLAPGVLPPSLTGIRVDNPPGRVAFLPGDAWDPDFVVPILMPLGVSNVNEPPFSSRDLLPETVLQAWNATPIEIRLPVRLAPSITAVRVDNPIYSPASRVPYSSAWGERIDPPVQRRANTVPVSLDNPPFTHEARQAAAQVAGRLWVPGAPEPTQLRKLSAGLLAVAVDNPTGSVSGVTVIAQIARLWAEPALPQVNRILLPASALAVQVDNPPFNVEDLPALLAAVLAWQPPEPASIVRAPSAILSLIEPLTPNREALVAALGSLLAAWQPPPPAPVLPRFVNLLATAVRVDEPPYSGRTEMHTILSAWREPDPMPVLSTARPTFSERSVRGIVRLLGRYEQIIRMRGRL